YLPGYYRADARTGTTRLNILITDLHSGRIFGSWGAWMSDIVALFLVVSLLTGFVSHRLKKRLQATNHREAARVLTPPPASDSQWARPVPVPVAVPAESQESSHSSVRSH
ncbi:MAG: PepSY domain-containing protein, partial [Terriglobia bacterium]